MAKQKTPEALKKESEEAAAAKLAEEAEELKALEAEEMKELEAEEATAKEAEVEAAKVAEAAKARQDAANKRAAELKALAEASPWHVVKDQSDQDTTMEACNIATGHQMPKAVLMRCRMKGKIVGNIILMQGLVVKQIKGIWQLK